MPNNPYDVYWTPIRAKASEAEVVVSSFKLLDEVQADGFTAMSGVYRIERTDDYALLAVDVSK